MLLQRQQGCNHTQHHIAVDQTHSCCSWLSCSSVWCAPLLLAAGNAARPLVRELVQGLPGQAKFNNPERPAASKLGVDPYLRVIGARDMVALGDCSMMVGDRLPATAQVGAGGRGRTGRRQAGGVLDSQSGGIWL